MRCFILWRMVSEYWKDVMCCYLFSFDCVFGGI